MCWLKRLSALKEAFSPGLFVQIKSIQLPPVSAVPEAARVRASPGAQQGRSSRQGGPPRSHSSFGTVHINTRYMIKNKQKLSVKQL